MSTFCPYCKEEIGMGIYNNWIGNYVTYFQFVCPKCTKEVKIEVETVPEFVKTHKRRMRK